jgi:hypothetical protein
MGSGKVNNNNNDEMDKDWGSGMIILESEGWAI